MIHRTGIRFVTRIENNAVLSLVRIDSILAKLVVSPREKCAVETLRTVISEAVVPLMVSAASVSMALPSAVSRLKFVVPTGDASIQVVVALALGHRQGSSG
jgi:hypothetical protein